MTTTETREAATPGATEQLAGRMFGAGVGAIELCNAYLGVHLGLYRALDGAPATAAELAARTGCDERYLREWLQGQAISGLVTVDGPHPASARFALADGTSDVLVDETGPAYLGGLTDALAAAATVLPVLADAYRTGAGVPYAAYGRDAVSAQAALNRPAFVNSLVSDWLPQVPGVLDRLRDGMDPARVADLGCGMGWAAIELAKAFPAITVAGRDNDETSISRGRQHAVEHGVADRVNLEVLDVSDAAADWSPRYDLVLFVECVHDFPRPVEALENARRSVRPGGTVLVVDDGAMNRRVLTLALEREGHHVEEAHDGRQALELLAHRPFDVVLLDLIMPEMDGYATLEAIKADDALRHLPVIVISGVDELDSVVRCIEMGATDYLSKPFNASLLRARVNASLAGKRLRDLELEYLEQVGHVIDAASAVEAGTFDATSLGEIGERDDALGLLARTFARMAGEVRAREDRLRREVADLRIEIDEARQTQKVAEITSSDYFRDLRGRAAELRRVVDARPDEE